MNTNKRTLKAKAVEPRSQKEIIREEATHMLKEMMCGGKDGHAYLAKKGYSKQVATKILNRLKNLKQGVVSATPNNSKNQQQEEEKEKGDSVLGKRTETKDIPWYYLQSNCNKWGTAIRRKNGSLMPLPILPHMVPRPTQPGKERDDYDAQIVKELQDETVCQTKQAKDMGTIGLNPYLLLRHAHSQLQDKYALQHATVTEYAAQQEEVEKLKKENAALTSQLAFNEDALKRAKTDTTTALTSATVYQKQAQQQKRAVVVLGALVKHTVKCSADSILEFCLENRNPAHGMPRTTPWIDKPANPETANGVWFTFVQANPDASVARCAVTLSQFLHPEHGHFIRPYEEQLVRLVTDLVYEMGVAFQCIIRFRLRNRYELATPEQRAQYFTLINSSKLMPTYFVGLLGAVDYILSANGLDDDFHALLTCLRRGMISTFFAIPHANLSINGFVDAVGLPEVDVMMIGLPSLCIEHTYRKLFVSNEQQLYAHCQEVAKPQPKEEKDNPCSICQYPMDQSVCGLKCSHKMHAHCFMNQALTEQRRCPECRKKLFKFKTVDIDTVLPQLDQFRADLLIIGGADPDSEEDEEEFTA